MEEPPVLCSKTYYPLYCVCFGFVKGMESNGEKGKIHCSPSTAALLPERWITPRADKIVAKGKGEMQSKYNKEFGLFLFL